MTAALAAAAGCTGADDGYNDVTRADSAGVRIITSGAHDSTLAWRFEEIDVFRDSLGTPYLFNALFTFHVLTDRAGRTYVLVRDPGIVRFGRDGRYERTIGRRGGGPGEFQLPIGIGSQGDTIFGVDGAKNALVRFGPDLQPLADRRLEGALSRVELPAFRNGGVWFRKTELSDTTFSQAVYGDTLGGSALHRVTERVGASVRFSCVDIPNVTPIFAPRLAMHANGARVLVNVQPEYALWLHEGTRPIASIRRPLTPHAPTVADVRGLFPNGMTVGMPGGKCVVPVEELMAKQGVAKQYPFVFDVVLLSDGSMWALRTPHAVTPPVVDVFTSAGAYAGSMRGRGLPLGLLPNGELLFARADTASGGMVIARTRVRR